MANPIKPKRSYTPNSVPTTGDLQTHEMAINWNDGKIFTKDAGGSVVALTLGGGGGGISWVTAPALPTSSGTAGQVACDSTYYYICTASNTWRRVAIAAWSEDAYISYVKLLMHLDGANQATTFTDSSTTPKSFTATNGAIISTGQNKWGGASLYPNGGYISASYSSDFNAGTGDFAWDAWIYPTSSSGIYGIYATSGGSGSNPKFVIHLDSLVPKIHYNNLTNGSDIYTSATSAVTVNTWTHIAFSRSGGTWRWYLGGTLAGSGSNSTTLTFSTAPTYIGYGGESYFGSFAGYIDDVRLTIGSDRGYTGSTITVPIAAFPNP